MNILLGSHHFHPSTGGIETVSDLLAREFVKRGHDVRVITQTAAEDNIERPFRVVRQPGARELRRLVQWCDVFLQNNISLQTLWPLLLCPRRLVIAHQTWITDPDGKIGWRHQLKRFALRFATSVAISDAVAARLPGRSVVIGNPYNDQVFRQSVTTKRAKDLIFVGRLVSDKGADLLLDAIAALEMKPRLTIAGDGPERARLVEQVSRVRLEGYVDFVGMQSGEALAKLLNQHKILVVPSRWAEPFGIVALEGIACGCVVVGSAEGGLSQAIGPCGVTFPNGNRDALAAVLQRLLADSAERARLIANAGAHLARFTRSRVADEYLAILQHPPR